MGLIDYSDSESENEGHEEANQTKGGGVPLENDMKRDRLLCPGPLPKKRKAEQADEPDTRTSKLPRLPTVFHSMYATSVRTSISDDPELHGGRRRQVPHMQGNWPAHVYLEWIPEKHDMDSLDSLINQAQNQLLSNQQVTSFLRSSLGAQLPLHISLSAPLVLTTPVKDNFRVDLTNALQNARIKSFDVTPSSLDWVPNFDGSRHFLILRLTSPANDELNCLLRNCNASCRKFNLPTLYQQSSTVGVVPRLHIGAGSVPTDARIQDDRSDAFHVSIAWTLQDPTDEAKRAVHQLNLDVLDMRRVPFTQVQIKIGNVVESVTLHDK